MAFIVEDGTGIINANSYASVAAADAYHADHGAPAAWTAANTAAKQAGLTQATQYIDNIARGRWKGQRQSFDQALAWPRAGVTDADDYLVSHDEIPQRLIDCVSVLALSALSATLLVDEERTGGLTVERVKAGPVEYETHWSGSGSGAQVKYSTALALIKDFLCDNTVAERG